MVKTIRKVSLFFQFDTSGGANASFRVGTQTGSYALDTATDYARCWDNFVILQLPTAEVIESLSGTVVSNKGMGYLRINQGDTDEFVYTIIEANYFTNANVRTVQLRVDTTSSFFPNFYPRV